MLFQKGFSRDYRLIEQEIDTWLEYQGVRRIDV